MERTCFRFVHHLVRYEIHLSSLLRWDQLHLVLSHASRQTFCCLPPVSLFIIINETLHATFALADFSRKNEKFSQQLHVQARKTLQKLSPRAFPSLSRILQLYESVGAPSSALSPPLSRKMSWMKMCFMSHYTILLFSISKFHSVFI